MEITEIKKTLQYKHLCRIFDDVYGKRISKEEGLNRCEVIRKITNMKLTI